MGFLLSCQCNAGCRNRARGLEEAGRASGSSDDVDERAARRCPTRNTVSVGSVAARGGTEMAVRGPGGGGGTAIRAAPLADGKALRGRAKMAWSSLEAGDVMRRRRRKMLTRYLAGSALASGDGTT